MFIAVNVHTMYVPCTYMFMIQEVTLQTGMYIWNLAAPDIEGFFNIEAFDIEGCFDIEYTTFDIELPASISKLKKNLRYRRNFDIDFDIE
jgi:hypothetical protein